MKRIIVCCDGTWNTWNRHWASNVVKTARAISPTAVGAKAGEYIHQVVFYDEGVGSGNILDRFLGGAFGHGLESNIEDAYRFLVNNYEQGDEIWLFGFSRGAYTARSTNGLLRKAGLLRKHHGGMITEAMKLYRRRDSSPDPADAVEFRRAYSHANPAFKPDDIKSNVVDVHFIGVWDTVGSRGVPLRSLRWVPWNRKYLFHNQGLSSLVKHAFHAVAIDEKRGTFPPTLWENVPSKGQEVEQVWFSGVHSEVGGGSSQAGLSNLALTWMMEKAKACGLGFDETQVRQALHECDPHEAVDVSLSGFYRFLLPQVRRLGLTPAGYEGGPQSESLHPSVCIKYNAQGAPRLPRSLQEYVRRADRRLAKVGDAPWRRALEEDWPAA